MIRNATFSDIPRIVLLLQEAFYRSHYARDRLGDVDVAEAKKLLTAAISRHGGRNGGSCWVQVSVSDGQICGLLVGTLARTYCIGNKLTASDLFWLTNEKAPVQDAMALMRNFISWAKSVPSVSEVKCGVTAILQDHRAAGKLLARLKMQPYGEIYRANADEL